MTIDYDRLDREDLEELTVRLLGAALAKCPLAAVESEVDSPAVDAMVEWVNLVREAANALDYKRKLVACH